MPKTGVSLPWQRAGLAPLSFLEQTTRLAAFSWLEARLFETLGHWAAHAPDPAWRALYGSQARHHAQHAEWLLGLVPDIADTDRMAGLVAPSAAATALLGAINELDITADGGLIGGAVWYRVVLPRLETSYSFHRARLSPTADAAIARVLGWIEADLHSDRVSGEASVQSHLTTPDFVEACTNALTRVERAAVAAGATLGVG